MIQKAFVASQRGSVVKNPSANQDMWVWSLSPEDPPGERNGNSLQYSCLGNSMDRGTWGATVKRTAKNWTWFSKWRTKSLQMTVLELFPLLISLPHLNLKCLKNKEPDSKTSIFSQSTLFLGQLDCWLTNLKKKITKYQWSKGNKN